MIRIPLTKYGWPQVAAFPAIQVIAMAAVLVVGAKYLPVWVTALIECVFAAALVLVLIFFRDPKRIVPPNKGLLLAPADGKITDIVIVTEDNFICGAALRIGIFLSILDVHINRAPCNVKVERTNYKKGAYGDAREPLAGRINESNDLWLVRTDYPQDRLIVRQISGAVARRIVCATGQGRQLAAGETFGMIKFGSRTELYLPAGEKAACLVQVGDKVKAGLSPLVRYE